MDDGNGLNHMRARYYRADSARFVSLDSLRGKIADPMTLNRYPYVNGNPMVGVDPNGKDIYDSCNKNVGNLCYWAGYALTGFRKAADQSTESLGKALELTGSAFFVTGAVGSKLIIEGSLRLVEMPAQFLGDGDPGWTEWWQENITNQTMSVGVSLSIDAYGGYGSAGTAEAYANQINTIGTTIASIAQLKDLTPAKLRDIRSLDSGEKTLNAMLTYLKNSRTLFSKAAWVSKISATVGDKAFNAIGTIDLVSGYINEILDTSAKPSSFATEYNKIDDWAREDPAGFTDAMRAGFGF